MTSLRPRTMRSLPASKSSDAVVLPSAEIEIQDSSRAWMTTVNSPGSAAAVKSDEVLGATDGAGCPGGGLLVDAVVSELVVGGVFAVELAGGWCCRLRSMLRLLRSMTERRLWSELAELTIGRAPAGDGSRKTERARRRVRGRRTGPKVGSERGHRRWPPGGGCSVDFRVLALQGLPPRVLRARCEPGERRRKLAGIRQRLDLRRGRRIGRRHGRSLC